MPDPQDFPGTYEIWEQGGDQITTLPRYASKLRTEEYLTIDGTDYKVERITHTINALGSGWNTPSVKVEVSIVI